MRNPDYFIAGNEPGYAQDYVYKETHPQHVVRATQIYAEGALSVSRELYLPTTNGLVTFDDRLIFRSTAVTNQVQLTRYQCVTRMRFNGQAFTVHLEPGQALCLEAPGGLINLHAEPDVDCPLIIRAGNGSCRVQTGAGLADISLGNGDHAIKVNQGLAFIRTAMPARLAVDGHYLKGAPGSLNVLARNAEDDHRFTAPMPPAWRQVGAQGIEVVGSEAFRREVEENMDLLRRLECGRTLLAALERPGRGYPIRITEHTGQGGTVYHPSSEESDEGTHFITQGEAGVGLSGGNLSFAPSRAGTVELPLLELYRSLCMAWNSINGTVFPGDIRLPYNGRLIDVPAWELQAIGVATGLEPFDFGVGSTPTNTNPAPFNEQSLRAELNIQPFVLA